MVEIPSLFFPTPVWAVTPSNDIIYVPPNESGSVRIERYNASGRPELLITGQLPISTQKVTAEEIKKRIGLVYYQIFHTTLTLAQCSGTTSVADQDRAVECATIRYLTRVAQRSPRFIPAIEGIVAMNDNGFSLKTSHVNADSSIVWFLADSTGNNVHQLNLKSTERIIGSNANRPIIVSDSGYRMRVAVFSGSH